MKHSTAVSRIQEGQARSQAKGAKRKDVVVKGLGLAVATAMEQGNHGVRLALVALIGQNDVTVLQAQNELEQRRDERVKECKGERKDKKIASVRVMYSRLITIVKAIHRKLNLDKMKAAGTFAEMYAFASNKSTSSSDKRKAKPFTDGQFKLWTARVTRIIGPIPGKQAKKAELHKFSDQVAHLEQHLRDVLGTFSTYSLHTTIPVRDMLGLIARKGKHVALVRKAA